MSGVTEVLKKKKNGGSISSFSPHTPHCNVPSAATRRTPRVRDGQLQETPAHPRLIQGGRGLCFFSSRRRHTRLSCDWSSDVCSSDLMIRHTRLSCDWSSDVCSSD